MQLLDLTLSSLVENLALDEALLLEAEADQGGELLRFWEWPHAAVILGAGCRLAEDVDEAACQAGDVPILRRASGGGTVLLASGCLCYSLILSYERSPVLREISSSYAYILDRIRQGLSALHPIIEAAGTSDLAIEGRKFSGNAQQRKRNYLLHHGTLLYDFDPTCVARYLRLPARQPEYRNGREHSAFLCNLPATALELRHRLQNAWNADRMMSDWPERRVRELVHDKYAKSAWTRRR